MGERWWKDEKHFKIPEAKRTLMHTYTQHAYWGLHQTKFKHCDKESSLTNLDNVNDRKEFGVNTLRLIFYFNSSSNVLTF